MRAAAEVIIAADCRLQRAAPPRKAVAAILIETTAGGGWWAGVILVTDSWRAHWRGRGWTRVGWVLALLYGVRWFHSDTAFPGGCLHVTLHPDVASLSPVSSP